jgi:hypothetical protein
LAGKNDVSSLPSPSISGRKNDFSVEESEFDGGRINTVNMMWLELMDKSLIPSTPGEAIGERASKRHIDFDPRRGDRQ